MPTRSQLLPRRNNNKQDIWLMTRHGANFAIHAEFLCRASASYIPSLASYYSEKELSWDTNTWIKMRERGSWGQKLFLAASSRHKLPRHKLKVSGPFQVRSYESVRTRPDDRSRPFDAKYKGFFSDSHLYLLRSVTSLGAPIVSFGICETTSPPSEWEFVLPLILDHAERCPDVRYSTWGTEERQLCYRKDFTMLPPKTALHDDVVAQLVKVRTELQQALVANQPFSKYDAPHPLPARQRTSRYTSPPNGRLVR